MKDEKKQASVMSGDINKILADPTDYPLPKPGTRGVVALELARMMTKENFTNLNIYLARLGVDIEVAVVLEAIRRDTTLLETRAYINFAEKYADLTF